MRYLFVHQNAPGQFKHLAPRLAADPANQVVFVTQPGRPKLPGVKMVEYKPHREVSKDVHKYVRSTEEAALNAQGVVRVAMSLANGGFRPDVIVGHPGWGETLLLPEVFPEARIVHFCEFYYSSLGADIGFDAEFPSSLDTRLGLTFRNAPQLMALEIADACYAPTHWQRAQFPETYRDRIAVIHDGIDCDQVRPDPAAVLDLPGFGQVRAGDKIVTYVARGLEPYRGFHSFVRMLPHLFEREPEARVVVIGADTVHYGAKLPEGQTFRQRFLAEVDYPKDRVHFLGRVPYPTFLKVLQVSAAHVYLTYPFVLSWSCLEAMAAGCLVIGSRTAPVEEAITDGETGLLTDFFDPLALADKVAAALKSPGDFREIRRRARESVQARYALEDCIGRQLALIRGEG